MNQGNIFIKNLKQNRLLQNFIKRNISHTLKFVPISNNIQKFTQQNQKLHNVQQKTQITLVHKNFYQFSGLPSHVVLNMPSLSPTMEKGKIVEWIKKVGDKVDVGQILCEIETDKATVGFEMQDEGYLAKVLKNVNEEINVGEPVAIIVENESDVSAFANYTGGQTQALQQKQQQPAQQNLQTQEIKPEQQQQQTQCESKFEVQNQEVLLISPYARKLALENNIQLSNLQGQGSGYQGRIIAQDVEKKIDQGQQQVQQKAQQETVTTQQQQKKVEQAPVQGNNYEDIPVTNVRGVIAKRLLESKTTIPHYYLSINVNMDHTLELRQKLNQTNQIKLSVNDFIVKACSLACRDVPECNSQWMGDKIRKFKDVDVSVAVSTDNGLITPIITQANKKGLAEISETTKDLAKRARENKLKPQEFQGGTFTVSNLGMFGIDNFSAVINPPQSCILAVGKTEQKVVPNPDTKTEKNYKFINSMSVTLSCDHRVVDGAVGAQWLQAFKKYMENPSNMLL